LVVMRALAITDLEAASLDAHVAAYAAFRGRRPEVQLSVQIRIPGAAGRRLLAVGRRLATLGLPLFVNDRLDVARTLAAEFPALPVGAHLGRHSVSVLQAKRLLGAGTPVSVACHSPHELVAARDQGASFALYSPIFPSPGKGRALGLEALTEGCVLARPLPVLALGGVDERSAQACLDAGAAGFAAIRAFLRAPDRDEPGPLVR
jgi:thiamine-phosphate diphosphorylase